MVGLGVHLCGSVPLADAESVFEQIVSRLGRHIARLPDGETGERTDWVVCQVPKLLAHPDLEAVETTEPVYGPPERVRLRKGIDPGAIYFGPLGYAQAALHSWSTFERLRDQGIIPPRKRFQVSLPTPAAVIGLFHVDASTELEVRYEARLLAELDQIAAGIPAEDLAIQWDVAIEFAVLEGVIPSWFGTSREEIVAGVTERLARLGNAVPDRVDLGYHLCYGDYGRRPFIEPADAGDMVTVANRLAASLRRDLNWIHLPVPRDRADPDFYAPLARLDLPAETELYLGLVHTSDGFEGGRRRIRLAGSYIRNFGIAAECGFGRRPAEQIPDLLDLHASLANSLD